MSSTWISENVILSTGLRLLTGTVNYKIENRPFNSELFMIYLEELCVILKERKMNCDG